MNTQNRKPRWRQLMLFAPLMLGLLFMDTHLALSTVEHQLIEVGIVLLMYGAMACWLWANQEALENEDDQEGKWQRLDPAEWQALEETSLVASIARGGDAAYPFAESALSDVELQKVLYRPVNHCPVPSGARLN